MLHTFNTEPIAGAPDPSNLNDKQFNTKPDPQTRTAPQDESAQAQPTEEQQAQQADSGAIDELLKIAVAADEAAKGRGYYLTCSYKDTPAANGAVIISDLITEVGGSWIELPPITAQDLALINTALNAYIDTLKGIYYAEDRKNYRRILQNLNVVIAARLEREPDLSLLSDISAKLSAPAND